MPRQDAFLDQVLAQLSELDGLRARAMFGGFGLYGGAAFFGIVYRGRLYLRTTPASRPRYTEWGMGPFRPNEKQTLWDYYEVPRAVLDDTKVVLTWAREAVAGREASR